ncbi:ribonuclease III [Syntrophotalea acetylenivorans]|nr:ribonuclease III [Syntrophotalea acetylenivorans]
MQTDQDMQCLQDNLGYRFSDSSLLIEALTHKSYSNEQRGDLVACNERLEFLGDAVLDLVVSRYMFRCFPAAQEGELTRIRAEVVSEKGLSIVARTLQLGHFLRLGRGEERSGGREKDSLMANALEALLGAVFSDGGFDSACVLVERLFAKSIAEAAQRKHGLDHKTHLQEITQARYAQIPDYVLVSEDGPEHRRHYTVEVRLADKPLGQGQGSTKKKAEQLAALVAISRLSDSEG